MSFSALQRAEIAEIISFLTSSRSRNRRFSALQRAEIAEIPQCSASNDQTRGRFSALQRAEIAEIMILSSRSSISCMFQCSSTSRNC